MRKKRTAAVLSLDVPAQTVEELFVKAHEALAELVNDKEVAASLREVGLEPDTEVLMELNAEDEVLARPPLLPVADVLRELDDGCAGCGYPCCGSTRTAAEDDVEQVVDAEPTLSAVETLLEIDPLSMDNAGSPLDVSEIYELGCAAIEELLAKPEVAAALQNNFKLDSATIVEQCFADQPLLAGDDLRELRYVVSKLNAMLQARYYADEALDIMLNDMAEVE